MINFLRHFRSAHARRRAPRAAAAPLAFPADSRQPIAASLPADSRRTAARRGISLLEVLISMFVLLFGLMGVAAIFPVGNHYAGRGEQFDRGSALAEAAFADLKARGMLKPEYWFYATKPTGFTGSSNVFNFIMSPTYGDATTGEFKIPLPTAIAADHPGYAFVIEPMGAAAGRAQTPALFPNHSFPGYDANAAGAPVAKPAAWTTLYGSEWPIRRMTLLQAPNQYMSVPVAETIFRLRDDVTNELPAENDRPGIQRWTAVDSTGGTPNNTPKDPSDDTLLARSYAGNYSWLATVVPTSNDSLLALQPTNSRFGSDLYEVSVAVFNKREVLPSAESERTIFAQMLQGNELLIYDANVENVDAAAEGIRPGNWIAVAGERQGAAGGQLLLKWYRILSIDDETQEDQKIYNASGNLVGSYSVRRVMLDGPDWPLAELGTSGVRADITPQAILLPGVISVSTQMLPMESAQ